MNTRKQGDIGVSQAIYWYTKNGWNVSKPMSDSTRYDLVIEKNGILKRVECKTTFYEDKYGTPIVSLRTKGGNRSWNLSSKKISPLDTDFVFVSDKGESAYEFPVELVADKSTISLSAKYLHYKVI